MSKILVLRVSGADEDFERELISSLDSAGAAHEIVDLDGGDYGAVLDRLGPSVLPVVLRPAIGA
ncbi:hypothetical protein [Roseovarius sp.]|uniref:hypothetical protein n=1 Tax=Roseovarius sp. TaxID=1486281 RepID=UPI00356278C4